MTAAAADEDASGLAEEDEMIHNCEQAFFHAYLDNRDWPEIDSWAANISDQLQLESAIHGATT